MKRLVAFLDVFAERPLAGNGLAVVEDADAVSDEVMLAFARETRLSETTYLQTASDDSADYRNRIWTPGEEVPFAGHPSLGTAVAVARWRGLSEASLVQQTGAGLQPVEVIRAADAADGGERWRASMLQGPAELGAEIDPEATMAAAGLKPADADPELPAQFASAGLPLVLAPVASAEALGRVSPDYAAFEELLSPHDAVMLYLAYCEPDQGQVRARMFSHLLELGEDPATGSAVGPLCAYLAERTGCRAITVRQGEEMKRPSVLEAEMQAERIRVGGGVIPLIEGVVELPDGA